MPNWKKRKIGIQDLETEEFPTEEATLYEIWIDGVKFEFLLYLRPDRHRAVIFATGALDGSDRAKWPIFSRSSWAPDLPVTSIYWFDPTCYEGEASLCWGYGIGDRWYLREIAGILELFLRRLEIPIGQTLFFGSSGGGFTSMMLACMMRGRATVFNPQVFVENYTPKSVERFKETVLRSPEERLIRERIDAPAFFKKEGHMPPIHLFQNIFFTESGRPLKDRDTQLFPFLRAVESLRLLDGGRTLDVDLYSNLCGHNGLIGKEETIRIILEDLERAPVEGDLFYHLVRRADYAVRDGQLYVSLALLPHIPKSPLQYSFALLEDGRVLERSDPSPEPSAVFQMPLFDGSGYEVEWSITYMGHTRTGRQHVSLLPVAKEHRYDLRDGELTFEITPAGDTPDGAEWAYYLYIDGVRTDTRWYSKETGVRFKIPERDQAHVCQIRYFLRYGDLKKSWYADPFPIPPIPPSV